MAVNAFSEGQKVDVFVDGYGLVSATIKAGNIFMDDAGINLGPVGDWLSLIALPEIGETKNGN
jgi:hypothetical protein